MKHISKLLPFLLSIGLLLVACAGRTTPPGPNQTAGTVGDTSYTLLHWEEGLRILLWSDIVGGAGSAGSGSTERELYEQTGTFEALDGRTFAYELTTSDGVTANFTVDGTPYDLERGTLFLITTAGDQTEVRQLDEDLTGLTPTNEGIEAFGRAHPEIATLISASSGR